MPVVAFQFIVRFARKFILAGFSIIFLLLVARLFAADVPTNAPPGPDWFLSATNRVWIWETNALDKQTCRFWKSFEIPSGAKISRATLRITVDNGYTLFLDGQEIGRGSDWRTVTEYDLTWLLSAGHHVLAVEGFNDRLEAGVIFGLKIQLVGRPEIEIASDDTWFVVPKAQRNWTSKKNPASDWHHTIVVGSMHQHPWEAWPMGVAVEPPLHPVFVHFWQRGWFQLTLFLIALAALSVCIWLMTQLTAQSQAQNFLQAERARIARDIHDDVGAQLTQLVLLGEVAQREHAAGSPVQNQFLQICERARELSHAMDEVVWAVNSRRDTVRDFVSYVCKYAQLFLSSTPIRCRLDVAAEIPETAFDLPIRRNLFLAVKEALNNAAKHSQASELFLRIFFQEQQLTVMVEDDGVGFDSAQVASERNGMTNMAQRMVQVGGKFGVVSEPGSGTLITFVVPLHSSRTRLWFLRKGPLPKKTEPRISSAE